MYCVFIYSIKKPVSSHDLHTSWWRSVKNVNPRHWGCAREGKKYSSICFLNKGPPSLLANRYSISQPLLSQPQLAPHKHEDWCGESSVYFALALKTSNSSESDSCNVCASIGVEETAARASQPWDEALNLSCECREKAVPVSTSADRSLCEPAGAQPSLCLGSRRDQSPGDTRAWACLTKERQTGSECLQGKQILSQNRQHKECVWSHTR